MTDSAGLSVVHHRMRSTTGRNADHSPRVAQSRKAKNFYSFECTWGSCRCFIKRNGVGRSQIQVWDWRKKMTGAQTSMSRSPVRSALLNTLPHFCSRPPHTSPWIPPTVCETHRFKFWTRLCFVALYCDNTVIICGRQPCSLTRFAGLTNSCVLTFVWSLASRNSSGTRQTLFASSD